MKTAHSQIGTALRMRRKQLGLSQSELCDLAGVGLAFLYNLEHGKHTVRMDKVLAVLHVLGLGFELGQNRAVLSVNPSLGVDHDES